MCLDVVDNRGIKSYKEGREYVGYKAFSCRGGLFNAWYFKVDKSYPTNKWMHEKDFRPESYRDADTIGTNGLNQYPKGFHVVKTKRVAEHYSCNQPNEIIKRIKFRNVVALGKSDLDKVIIAKEIFIPED